jgi:hypothetical protein
MGDMSLADQARADASICACSQRRNMASGRQSCRSGG